VTRAYRTGSLTMTRSRRGLLAVLGILGLSMVVDSVTAENRRKERRKRRRKRRRDNRTPALQRCGGFAGVPCAPGFTCVDDPRDTCDPARGGADCSGICVQIAPNPCAGILCRAGTTCCPACGGVCIPGDVPCSIALCPRELCGPVVCPPGTVCCNSSCGICTPPGGACILIACLPDQ
jgi:hypothetical protein